jgi:hypothetical protein
MMRYAKKMRFLLGFLVAPLVPGLIFAINDQFSSSPVGPIWYLSLTALVGYPIATILGIPMYYLLFRNKAAKFSFCILFGFILGTVAYLALFIPGLISAGPDAANAFKSGLGFLLVSGFCGAIAGASFWLIARPE